MLKNPTEKLKNLSDKARAYAGMRGGCAARDEALQSGHLGSFGGNMDYNQIREGVTLYLPVYHPGALLFVGDGHAVQGDGEADRRRARDFDGCGVHGGCACKASRSRCRARRTAST